MAAGRRMMVSTWAPVLDPARLKDLIDRLVGAAGLSGILVEHRQALTRAVIDCIAHRDQWEAAATQSKVRPLLASVEKCSRELRDLLSQLARRQSAAATAAKFMLLGHLRGGDLNLKGVRSAVIYLQDAAQHAVAELPKGRKGNAGRHGKPFRNEFILKAHGIYEAAGGTGWVTREPGGPPAGPFFELVKLALTEIEGASPGDEGIRGAIEAARALAKKSACTKE